VIARRVSVALLGEPLLELGSGRCFFAAELVPSILKVGVDCRRIALILGLQKIDHTRWMIVEHSLTLGVLGTTEQDFGKVWDDKSVATRHAADGLGAERDGT